MSFTLNYKANLHIDGATVLGFFASFADVSGTIFLFFMRLMRRRSEKEMLNLKRKRDYEGEDEKRRRY